MHPMLGAVIFMVMATVIDVVVEGGVNDFHKTMQFVWDVVIAAYAIATYHKVKKLEGGKQ